MQVRHCKRCGKDWVDRGLAKLVRCGKCKSPYWDVAKGDGSPEAPQKRKKVVPEPVSVEITFPPPGSYAINEEMEKAFGDNPFDYSDTPFEDCPPEEKKRRRAEAMAKRGIAKKGFS